MDSIEQAILHLKDHRNPETAVILAKTHGVRQIDEEELLGWAFDYEGDFVFDETGETAAQYRETDLTPPEFEPRLYFHPLPSGCYVLGHQTVLRDSSSDFISLVSHCLIITPRLLRAFHNDVLAIRKALMTREDFHFFTLDIPAGTTNLSPIPIGVRHIPVIEAGLLEAVCDYPGAVGFANLLSLSIHSVCSIFTWLTPPIPLIHSIIQCLPVSLRPELTFATSLHFSSVRPFRLLAVHENSRKAKDICCRFAIPFFHIAYLDVNMLRERLLSHPSWATFVYHVFDRNAYDLFVRCITDHLKSCPFASQHGTADWNMLNQVGKSLLELWNSDGIEAIDNQWREIVSRDDLPAGSETLTSMSMSDKPVDTRDNLLLRGDCSHERFQSEIISTTDRILNAGTNRESVLKGVDQPASTGSRPASQRRLALRFPQYEREIRLLDSLIARSLFGDAMALEALEGTWGKLRKHLTYGEFEAIRETYIHLVQSIIVQPRDPDYPKPPRRTLDSLDVMNIFLQEK